MYNSITISGEICRTELQESDTCCTKRPGFCVTQVFVLISGVGLVVKQTGNNCLDICSFLHVTTLKDEMNC